MFFLIKNEFSNFKTDISFAIFKIPLLAYDYLFKQQRNSHDEYLVNKKPFNKKGHLKWKKHFQPRGRHVHCPSSGAVKSRFKESLKVPNSLG